MTGVQTCALPISRLIIDEMSGDLGMTYVNDVASWYARENIRSGYQIRVAGHCFKGPYAIMWDQIQIIFEDEHVTAGLSLHLAQIWGPENVPLDEAHEARLDRIA